MSDAFASLAALAGQQQVAVGMIGAAVAGSLVFSLKAVPGKAWKAAKDLFSVTMVVEARDDLYMHLNSWLARTSAAGRAQRVIVQNEFDYAEGRWRWQITLGTGWHLVWVAGEGLLLVNRSETQGGELAQALGQGMNKRLWLVTLGRSQRLIRKVVAEAEEIGKGDGFVLVYFWHAGMYRLADRRVPRSLDTIYMPPAQKAGLLEDLAVWAKAREAYRRRGTPWRRGYLFEGQPGTGKTSLIFALASTLGRSIYLINLANISSDNDLIAAFNEVGWDGVVVIEDIDAAEISRDRDQVAASAAPVVVQAPGAPQQQRLTLSGLLNAIDGVAAREGRVLFATTNHPEKLDAALLRPGRFDVREAVGPLGKPDAWAMAQAFGWGGEVERFETQIGPRLPMPAAALQNLLQRRDAHAVREEPAHG